MTPFTARPEIRGTVGEAASTHWIALKVAFGVLGAAAEECLTAPWALWQ